MMRVMTVLVTALVLALPHAVAAVERPRCDEVRTKLQPQLEAACPCATAKSHAEHVRCVGDKLRELSACHKGADGALACGPLPRACIGILRRSASRSACGSPEAITCCVPRQRDCVGDPTPGDGKKEGTCGGTKQPCDVLADCKIAKCQPAPNAERCTQLGGTVGKGQDCNTACAP